MPKNKIYITLGVILALLPWIGLPHDWETAFVTLSGIAIASLTVWVTIDRRMTQRLKAQRRVAYRRAQAQIVSESAPDTSKLDGESDVVAQ